MKPLKIIIIFIIILISASAYSKPIDMQVGARPYSMGGAFVAIADDINATYWNPAGLTQLNSLSFGLNNWMNQQFMGVNINYMNLAVPIENVGVVGGSWLMLYAGLEEGDPDNDTDYRTDHWAEHTFAISAARKLWDKLFIFEKTSVGFNLNRYIVSTDEYHGAGIGFDLSLFTLFPYNIRLGLMARSLAADIMGDKVEPEYRIGLGYLLKINPAQQLTFAMDGLFKQDVEYQDNNTLDPVGVNVKGFGGLEYSFLLGNYRFDVRTGGYRMLRKQRKGFDFTTGLGITYKNYTFNYAFKYNTNNEASLGMAHRVGISFRLKPFNTETKDVDYETKEITLVKAKMGFLRENPDAKSKILFEVEKGTEIKSIMKQGDWGFVKTKDDREGWIRLKDLKIKKIKIKKVEKKLKIEEQKPNVEEKPGIEENKKEDIKKQENGKKDESIDKNKEKDTKKE